MRAIILTIVGGLIFVYSIAVETLDWAGRLEYMETHFPRVFKGSQHRIWRVTLMIVGLLLLGRAIYDLESNKNLHGNPSNKQIESSLIRPTQRTQAKATVGSQRVLESPVKRKRAQKETPKKIEGTQPHAAQTNPFVISPGAHIEQRTEAPNSANVVGNGNQVTIEEDGAYGSRYALNGTKYEWSPGRQKAIAGGEFFAFQDMVALEKAKQWQKLVDLSEVWIKKNPQWLGSYVLASEGYFGLQQPQRAKDLLDYVNTHAPATDRAR